MEVELNFASSSVPDLDRFGHRKTPPRHAKLSLRSRRRHFFISISSSFVDPLNSPPDRHWYWSDGEKAARKTPLIHASRPKTSPFMLMQESTMQRTMALLAAFCSHFHPQSSWPMRTKHNQRGEDFSKDHSVAGMLAVM